MRDDNRPLLLFFVHERSGPARRMESVMAHVARVERERLRVRRIDVDERPELAERFGVDTVPALALVKDRRVVARRDGRVSQPQIEAMLEPHLGARHPAGEYGRSAHGVEHVPSAL